MFNVKEIIKKDKTEGKSLVKFSVLGFGEKFDVVKQLDDLGYEYEVFNMGYEGAVTIPYDIVVGV